MDKRIIHTVFENIVEQFPENIAIEEQGGRTVTYQALNQQANQIAHSLREKGIKKGSVIGVLIPSSIEYVATLLGVFKVGGIFMPVNPNLPAQRLEYVFKQTSPKLIIGERETLRVFETLRVYTYSSLLTSHASTGQPQGAAPTMENPPLISEPDDGNYIVTTSGSTGDPKIILGRHKTLSHFIHWEIGEFQLNETTRASQLSPETNDVIFRDIFAPLISGGTLCIPDMETIMNTNYLIKWIESSKITLLHTVPSLFRLILKQIESSGNADGVRSLKQILMVGEELYGSDVIRWMNIFGNDIELVNLYGASETYAKSFNRIKERPADPHKAVHVGKPISNAAILILKDGELARINEIGEIYIKTPFITNGYYNNPDLTAKSFVQNPLIKDQKDIIYKTGDLGRYLPDRSVEFIGRIDRQVKINALRVELNEVESAIRSYDAIEQTRVTAYKTPDYENRLICYYTEKRPIESGELRAYLKTRLPDYMIPSYFVRLDEFPLTLTGKIDQRALPKPEDLMFGKIKYEAPGNPAEEKLAEIWQEVLGLKKVGVNHPYFEIGGNSLSAIRIVSRIYKAFEVEVSIKDFLEHSTVRELAGFISQARKTDYAEIQPLPKQDYYALSHAQRRLWILDQLETYAAAYNIPSAFFIQGNLNIPLLQNALQKIVKRHESLRTTFTVIDGEPMQKIHEDMVFTLDIKDLTRIRMRKNWQNNMQKKRRQRLLIYQKVFCSGQI